MLKKFLCEIDGNKMKRGVPNDVEVNEHVYKHFI